MLMTWYVTKMMDGMDDIVDYAVCAAMESPCQSKRGVVVWDNNLRWISDGWNHQPSPFKCDGSSRCRETCGKTAVHAEQSAIVSADECLGECHMLHVKARDWKPCASLAPSCLECSKLILESGISSMHLLHDPVTLILPGAIVVGHVEGFLLDGSLGLLEIRRYDAVLFHRLTADHLNIKLL